MGPCPIAHVCWCGVRCAVCESREAEMISSHCYLLAWISVRHNTISVILSLFTPGLV